MRTKMLPKIVIQNSTIGLGECMALLLCVFFSGGHLHWFWTDLWEKQRFKPLMLVFAAIFVLPAIVILRRQFDRSPQLIISPLGLDLRRSSAFFAGRFKISRFKSSRFKSRHRRPQRFIAWNKMRGKKIDFATLFTGRSPPPISGLSSIPTKEHSCLYLISCNTKTTCKNGYAPSPLHQTKPSAPRSS